MNFALIGFMGSGKTTTCLELYKILQGYNLFCIDKEIEKEQNSTISDIFKKYGEKYFRELEHKKIKDIISNNKNKNLILDLGGGAFIQENNRLILKENNIKTIFLDLQFEYICERLKNQRETRPLLKEKNWKENAKNLFEYRYNFYKKSDIVLEIKNNYTPKIVSKLILEILEKNIER